MGAIIRILRRAEDYITLFFFVLMNVFMLLQLYSRFIMKDPFVFTEEVARYSYVWITFIGMAMATKSSDHIRVDFFVGLLPPGIRAVLGKAVLAVSLVILVFLGYLGVRFMIFSRMNVSAALKIPLNLVYLSFPLGCLLAAVRTGMSLFSPGIPR